MRELKQGDPVKVKHRGGWFKGTVHHVYDEDMDPSIRVLDSDGRLSWWWKSSVELDREELLNQFQECLE